MGGWLAVRPGVERAIGDRNVGSRGVGEVRQNVVRPRDEVRGLGFHALDHGGRQATRPFTDEDNADGDRSLVRHHAWIPWSV